jgi:hypothetical protein
MKSHRGERYFTCYLTAALSGSNNAKLFNTKEKEIVHVLSRSNSPIDNIRTIEVSLGPNKKNTERKKTSLVDSSSTMRIHTLKIVCIKDSKVCLRLNKFFTRRLITVEGESSNDIITHKKTESFQIRRDFSMQEKLTLKKIFTNYDHIREENIDILLSINKSFNDYQKLSKNFSNDILSDEDSCADEYGLYAEGSEDENDSITPEPQKKTPKPQKKGCTIM